MPGCIAAKRYFADVHHLVVAVIDHKPVGRGGIEGEEFTHAHCVGRE